MTIRRLKIKGSDITVRALELPGGKYHVTNRDWGKANGAWGTLIAPDGTLLDVDRAHDREGAQVGYLCTPVTP